MKLNKLVSTLDMKHEDWLAYRKGGIGGSDAGAKSSSSTNNHQPFFNARNAGPSTEIHALFTSSPSF